MALPESDQRELVCADRERGPSQLSSDPARVPVGRKDPWSIVRIFSPTTARARAPGGERLGARASGPTAVIVRRSATINKSRQSRPQTQAHMGSS